VLGVGVVLLSDVVDPILVMLFGVGLVPDGGGPLFDHNLTTI
jgi:hypothetical protein